MPDRTDIAIDLKSFYASVECADRRLDPLATNLVVADESRTEKTICLAVSPSLKACGIPWWCYVVLCGACWRLPKIVKQRVIARRIFWFIRKIIKKH